MSTIWSCESELSSLKHSQTLMHVNMVHTFVSYWQTGRSFLGSGSTEISNNWAVPPHAWMRIRLRSKPALRAVTSLPDIRSTTQKKINKKIKSLLHPPPWHSRPTRGKSCNIYRKATWFPHSDRPIHMLLITSPGVRGRRAGWGRDQRDRARSTELGFCVLHKSGNS